MAELPHISKHRAGMELIAIPRRFDDAHLAANYHQQEHGEPSNPEHELHGIYATTRGRLIVSHIEGEPVFGLRCSCGAKGDPEGYAAHVEEAHINASAIAGRDEADSLPEPLHVRIAGSPTVGPEFQLEFHDGMTLTTLDAESTRDYLAQFSAIRAN